MKMRFNTKCVWVFINAFILLTLGYPLVSYSAIDMSETNQLQDTNVVSARIYDTSSDSDTGTWIKDSSKLWHKESGAFPKVAYLVLSNSGLDIIDANTKMLWMQFFKGFNYILPNADYTSIAALNGKIVLGTNSGVIIIDFKTETVKWLRSENACYITSAISNRYNPIFWIEEKNTAIINNNVNDVDITSCESVDYAAVATNKGISLINLAANASYNNSLKSGITNCVAFGGNNLYYGDDSGLYAKYNIEFINKNWSSPDFTYSAKSDPKIIGDKINDIAVTINSSDPANLNTKIYAATQSGVTEIQENRYLPSLSKTTHWADSTPDADYSILSSDNITHVTADGASLWLGGAFGVDEIKLVNKKESYKTYTTETSPSIVSNNVTSLSGNGLLLVGTQSGCTVLDDSWLDKPGYKYRQQLFVSNKSLSDLPEGYAVKFSFDHADLVNSGKSLVSGNDIRIAYYSDGKWTELDRAISETGSWNKNPTTICFKTLNAIPAGRKDSSYYLYYGNSKPGEPPKDKDNIYLVYEDFEKYEQGTPPAGWTNDSLNEFVVSRTISNRLIKQNYTSNENDITIDASSYLGDFELGLTARKSTNTNDTANIFGILFHSGNNGYRISIGADGNIKLLSEDFKLSTSNAESIEFKDDTDHLLKIQVYDTSLKTYWDTNKVQETTISKGAGKIGFFNDNSHSAGGPEIDNICIRKYIEPEPTVVSNNIEMANIPTGDIIQAEQTREGFVEITFTVDSPYDQTLSAEIEWSDNNTENFKKCYLGTSIATNYAEIEEMPKINNSSTHQVENILTHKGPNTVTIQWYPSQTPAFPMDTTGEYWLKLTASSDSSEQEVPDIISLIVDTRGLTVSIPEESQEAQALVSQTASTLVNVSQAVSNYMTTIAESAAKNISEYIPAVIPETIIQPETIIGTLPAKLAFITPPQTIPVNTLSKAITIQLQDINGKPINAEQDIVIELSTAGG